MWFLKKFTNSKFGIQTKKYLFDIYFVLFFYCSIRGILAPLETLLWFPRWSISRNRLACDIEARNPFDWALMKDFILHNRIKPNSWLLYFYTLNNEHSKCLRWVRRVCIWIVSLFLSSIENVDGWSLNSLFQICSALNSIEGCWLKSAIIYAETNNTSN